MFYELLSRILIALVKIFFQAVTPVVLKGVTPKDLTIKDKEDIASGNRTTLAGQGSGKFNHHKD